MRHVWMTVLAGLWLASGGLAGADSKPAGADAKPAGADAKPAGADAKPAGADAKPAGASAKPAAPKTSKTCKYKRGMKAGETQFFDDIDPVPIGAPCNDGGGSYGVVVPDLPRVPPKPIPTSRTCKFNDGAKAGKVQFFPDAQPIQIGTPCEDGSGSFGVAVADSKQPAATAVKTSRTCKYNQGPKTGHAQFFANATPLPLGSACSDGLGSSGVAAADKVSGPATSRTCSFTTGPRKGKSQHFPDAPPTQLGNYCEDGAGSAGVAIADRTPARK